MTGEQPQLPRQAPTWLALVLVAATAFAYTFSLNLGALAEPDEPRYAEIPREMLVRHDWVTPTLNFVKYFEKPPLVYWLTAGTFRLIGISDWSARVVPVLSTFATLAITWGIGRRLYDPWVALAGVAVLALSPIFFALGQSLTLDPTLTTCLTAAVAAFWFGYHSPQRQRAWYRAMYATMAFGVLTKGPVAVLLTGAIVATVVIGRRDWRALRRLFDPLGLLLFTLIVLPWFVLVSLRNPEFVEFFVIDQHVKRYLYPTEHRQPLWFYVPIVLAASMPWSLGFVVTPEGRRLLPPWNTWSAGTWFCLCWAGVVLVFFSLSRSKLIPYILPALPPLALLVARVLQVYVTTQTPLFVRLGRCFTVLGWGAIVGGSVATLLQIHPFAERIVAQVCATGVVLVAGSALMRRSVNPQRGLLLAAATWLAVSCVAISARDVTLSYRELGEAIAARATPADHVALYHRYTQGIAFYARRRVVLVGARSELDFGSRQGDQRAYFWPDEQLIETWASPARVFLVLNRTELDVLRPQLTPPPIEVAREGKKVVVVNHPAS